MKLKIKQVNRFDITVNGKTFRDFEFKSEWNGLMKFEHHSTPIGFIVRKPKMKGFGSAFTEIFGNIFDLSPGDIEEKELEIVNISESLIKND